MRKRDLAGAWPGGMAYNSGLDFTGPDASAPARFVRSPTALSHPPVFKRRPSHDYRPY